MARDLGRPGSRTEVVSGHKLYESVRDLNQSSKEYADGQQALREHWGKVLIPPGLEDIGTRTIKKAEW
jgi:hypothetical protein